MNAVVSAKMKQWRWAYLYDRCRHINVYQSLSMVNAKMSAEG